MQLTSSKYPGFRQNGSLKRKQGLQHLLIKILYLGWDIARGKDTFFKFIKRDIPVHYKFLLFGIIGITWILNIIRLR